MRFLNLKNGLRSSIVCLLAVGFAGCSSTTNNINTTATNIEKKDKKSVPQTIVKDNTQIKTIGVATSETNAKGELVVDKKAAPYAIPANTNRQISKSVGRNTEVIDTTKDSYPQVSYKIPKVVTKDRHISDISFTKPNQKKVVLVKKVFKEISQCAKEVTTVTQDLPYDEYYDFEVSVRKNTCCQKGGCDKRADLENVDKADVRIGR